MKKLTTALFTLGFAVLVIFGFNSCTKACEHIYDNDCDTACNECGAEREALGHSWSDATCTEAKTL